MNIKEDEINEQFIGTTLRDLGRVDPPSDFNFKVRARIAHGRPVVGRQTWLPVWAYGAAPAAAAILIGGYLFSGGNYSSSVTEGPTVSTAATQAVPSLAEQPSSPAPIVAVNETIARSGERQAEPSVRVVAAREVPSASRKIERPAGGSFDSAIRGSETITSARGANSNSVVSTGSSSAANRTPTTGSSLPSMGIRVAGNVVTAVLPGSTAAAAGVKIGDVIETVSGNVVTVRRDGKSLTFTVLQR
ncbi:MAG: hypothetical protein WKF34_02480 [Pyrinomonadaceae bacterium]